MRNTGKILGYVLVALLYCSCRSVTFSPEVDKLLAEVRKTRDPQGKLASIKTKIIKGSLRINTKEKPIKMILSSMRPDMIKVKVSIPGRVTFIKAFDGKTGWFFSTKKGPVKLKNQHLEQLKFQAMLLAPGCDLSSLFKSIKLDGESVEVGRTCYKFVCEPKDEFQFAPMVFYVDKKKMLIIKREEERLLSNGNRIKVVTIFNDYSPEGGILVPRNIISYRNGNLEEFNIESVEWNAPIDPSSFSIPEKMK